MDFGTIGGLILAALVIVVVMILDGGSPAELFHHPAAILLTLGGSFLAASVATPLSTTLSLPTLLLTTIKGNKNDSATAIDTLVKMADKARREGLLSLEADSQKISDPFLRKGLMLVVDGVDPAQVRAILEIEIKHMRARHGAGINLLNSAGGYAPTFGIIGTVMGLITVLQQLDEPATLGKAIAGAFLATLWGLLSANMIWLPLGGRLNTKSETEVAYRHLLIEGISALQAGENPRVLKEKLNAFMPPKSRNVESAASGAKKKKARTST